MCQLLYVLFLKFLDVSKAQSLPPRGQGIPCSFLFCLFLLFLNTKLHSVLHLMTVMPLVNRISLQFLPFSLTWELGVHLVLAGCFKVLSAWKQHDSQFPNILQSNPWNYPGSGRSEDFI